MIFLEILTRLPPLDFKEHVITKHWKTASGPSQSLNDSLTSSNTPWFLSRVLTDLCYSCYKLYLVMFGS